MMNGAQKKDCEAYQLGHCKHPRWLWPEKNKKANMKEEWVQWKHKAIDSHFSLLKGDHDPKERVEEDYNQEV